MVLAKAAVFPHGPRVRSLEALVFLLGGAAACSCTTSPPSASARLDPGTATLNGTFTFMPSDTSASASTSQVDPQHVSVRVTTLRGIDTCASAHVSEGAGAASVFEVVVAMEAASGGALMAPGMYRLGDGWQASFRRSDAACAASEEGAATSGELQIDSADTSVRGVADVTFPTGRVIAVFDASFCQPATNVSGGGCKTFPLCPVTLGSDRKAAPAEMCVE